MWLFTSFLLSHLILLPQPSAEVQNQYLQPSTHRSGNWDKSSVLGRPVNPSGNPTFPWFHTAKMSFCGTGRVSLVLCGNVIQLIQLSAIQLVNSRTMATLKSVDALFVRSGLCAAPGFLSRGSKIGKRTHCTVSKLLEANIPWVSCPGAGKEELLQTHEVFGDTVSERTTAAAPCARP